MTTLFENIINGEIPADILFQDDHVIAFRDINPQAPVHVLIVTKKVIPSVDDIADEDESLVGHLFTVARDIARQEGLAENGYRLIVNCGDDGGQEIYHLHVHLMGGQPIGPMVIG